ncbi:hypothetical protein GRX01_00695 [Halobaculum sp. WSA2]|uniref:DUF8135 domain-containing protein n=1 Tax=Halobaculum saliterrae TaxID=2073113 RepID=A0A6B0SVB7_9EURY|nr:hypothetical protein [Halobaculum saliterrae]MXR39880.1 hypothetical protein [Halobaculum saliterrae]
MAEEPSEGDRRDDGDGEPHDPFGDETNPDDVPSVENPFPADGPAADIPTGDSSDDDSDGDGDGVGREVDGDAPLGDLAREVSRRRRRGDDHSDPDPDDDPFEEVDVGDLDEDELWASLSGEGSGAETAAAGGPSADVSAGSSAVAEPNAVPVDGADGGDARPEHVLDKRQYCQRCPYLTAPPEVACEHDGTDILEVVDADRFRVRGCPMVTDEGRPAFSTAGEAERSEASMANNEVDAVDGDGPVADDFDA